MLLVEQNVAFGLRIVDRAHVMQTGRVVYAGSVRSLDRNKLASYLGIGRMLSASTTGALATRTRKPTAKRTPAKRAPAKRKPPVKKKPPTKRKPTR